MYRNQYEMGVPTHPVVDIHLSNTGPNVQSNAGDLNK